MTDGPVDSLSVAVIGLSGRFPGARSPEELWRLVHDGTESIRRFTPDELETSALVPEDDRSYVPAAGVLDDVAGFDAGFFQVTPREAALTDPQHRILLECAWEALERAGYAPEHFAGRIGVFAGSGLNTYFLNNLLPNPDALRTVAHLQVIVGADKDYLAPLISYKLGLKGPSVSVQTACSTSLVAVHLACQSLIDHHCDLALAGGASVRVPQRSGYRYQEGGIYSPDGHCRPFDARAGGTVIGSGAGMVALKRYEEALEDRDPIHAVIRGTAINNDGADKVGFTAPGVDGQVEVISEALGAAGVDPEAIGYVEAHGTATPLGDPIEVNALHRAFGLQEPRPESCALGSLKSNLGHLDAAAGVAGLIKAVLALEHRTIPPTVHFETPNPEIDFDAGPFFVPRVSTPWSSDGAPRRAGVSSFGIGGTNAHAVLEEAPAPAVGTPSRPWQLLLLSARSGEALEAATANLAAHLRKHPELELPDVAYTLQVGRRVFGHRSAVVCRDRDDARAALSGEAPERVMTLTRGGRNRPVVFLFPGQGTQYPGMTRGLYEAEPAFRRSVGACAAALETPLGLDLRTLLYPDADAAGEAASRLQETALAQPALFTVGYALARLWASWGVEPEAMLGHSVGAFVAATLAGVLDFQDALRLVALRGRLMQELPPGAMLSAALGEDELQLVLDDVNAGRDRSRQAEIAAVNGPGLCSASGEVETVEEVGRRLEARGVTARPLHTSHAFHSPMMEPIVERFAQAVAEVPLRPPERPFVSDLTGTWIGAEEATDPWYWARHLRGTVRFADGLATLTAEPARIFLELGPGRTLTTLALRHPGRGPDHDAIPTVPRPQESEPDGAADHKFLLTALGRLWLAGGPVDWPGFYGEERRRRVELPTYPFERRRHWIEAPATGSRSLGFGAPPRAAGSPGPPPGAEEAVDEAPPAAAVPLQDHGRPELTTAYVAPRDDVETRIAAVWQRALGIGRVGVHDDFFDLGGHSLLATEIAAAVRQELGVSVGLGELFERPTVAGMAVRVGDAAPADADEGPALPVVEPDPGRRGEPFPLTDVQQAYWIGRQGGLELGGVGTHIYREIEVADVDLARLERALDRVIERQHMLRAVMLADGRQRILDPVPPLRIGTLDLRRLSPERAASGLAAVRHAMSHQVLPADRWPLFEVRASLLAGGRTRFHVSFDFLIGDAWSFQVLSRELAHFYEHPETPLPPLEISFRDYVLAYRRLEDTPAFERALTYWRERLETLPPAPELPLARLPGDLEAPRFTRFAARLPADAWTRLQGRARDAGLTPSGVLLAAFSEVLAVWSKSPRFTLNLTMFNRLPLHRQVGELVGDFTSLTLLAVEHDAGRPFLDRARSLQGRLWQDLDHRLVSGVRVIRELVRTRGRAAAAMPVVFTSTLNMASTGGEVGGDGHGGEASAPGEEGAFGDEEGGYTISQTPQVWIDHQVTEHDGVLAYNWDVVEELFPPGLLRDLFEAYRDLLERLATDGELWRRRDLRLVPRAQLAVRSEVNATSGPVPRGLLQDGFHARASEAPDRPAVVTSAETVTYGRLERVADALARRLASLGAEPGRLVAVVLPKGWRQAAAVLGILDAGGAYLPVDPSLPAARRRFLLEDGGVALAVTDRRLAREMEWPDGVRPVVFGEILPEEEGAAPRSSAGPGDLAYVIYTSGSTGRPKGVMIDHRGALNTVADVNRRFGLGAGDRVLGISSLSFDLSVWDLFGLLGAGGTVVLPDPELAREPAHWLDLLHAGRVTAWNSVPPLMDMLAGHLEAGGEALPASVRVVLLSGDWIPVSLPGRVRRLAAGGEPQVVSLGGATEGSIWSILHPIGEVDPTWTSIPYGRPMTNQRFHVLRDDLGPRPDWVPGELAIAGLGVALGYWGDEDRTRERFITHPASGERLYRTGDLGRYRPDGTLEFLGREDLQVKIRGYRVELGEIEAALERHREVAEAVVTARADGEGPGSARRLVGYVVPRRSGALSGSGRRSASGPDAVADAGPEPEALREHLREHLPDYMVPPVFVRLERLPLTANGKIDRAALPEPERPASASAEEAGAPRTATERTVAALAGELLAGGNPAVGQSLFDLGADSLTAARLIARVRAELGAELPLGAFFEEPTVAGLARRIDGAAGGGGRPAIPRAAPGADAPLSCGQERLWRFHRRGPRRAVHNLVHALALPREVPPAAAARGLAEVVRRHETLRTRFRDEGGAPPVAEVLPAPPPRLPAVDLTALAPEHREEALRRAGGALAAEPFDLATGPPWRGSVVLGARPEAAVLVLVFHHAVVDAWSLGILARELRRLEEAPAAGEAPVLPAPPLQYGDFARWQRARLKAGELDEELAFWRDRLAGTGLGWHWPGGRSSDADLAARSFRGGTAVRPLGRERTDAVGALARRRSSTPFAVLLAAFAAALGRFTGRREVVVTTAADIRSRPELEGVVGYFVNLLPLRLRLGGGFESVLDRARETVAEAFAHAEAPFEALVREAFGGAADQALRDLGRVVFTMPRPAVAAGSQAAFPSGRSAAGSAPEPLFTTEVASTADLSLYAVDGPEGYVLRLGYDADVLTAADAERLVGATVDALDGGLGDREPAAPEATTSARPGGRTP